MAHVPSLPAAEGAALQQLPSAAGCTAALLQQTPPAPFAGVRAVIKSLPSSSSSALHLLHSAASDGKNTEGRYSDHQPGEATGHQRQPPASALLLAPTSYSQPSLTPVPPLPPPSGIHDNFLCPAASAPAATSRASGASGGPLQRRGSLLSLQSLLGAPSPELLGSFRLPSDASTRTSASETVMALLAASSAINNPLKRDAPDGTLLSPPAQPISRRSVTIQRARSAGGITRTGLATKPCPSAADIEMSLGAAAKSGDGETALDAIPAAAEAPLLPDQLLPKRQRRSSHHGGPLAHPSPTPGAACGNMTGELLISGGDGSNSGSGGMGASTDEAAVDAEEGDSMSLSQQEEEEVEEEEELSDSRPQASGSNVAQAVRASVSGKVRAPLLPSSQASVCTAPPLHQASRIICPGLRIG